MISIIVPVYNSEKTLERCVDSLLNQTLKELEIILVIDGSTDRSEAIGKAFEQKDGRVKAVIKENEGVSPARNTGLALAKGEYIQFVDSDDYISPDMCEALLDAVDKTGADMALCGFHHMFSGRDIEKKPETGVYHIDGMEEAFISLYQAGFLNMPWNKLFKRERIKSEFDPELSLGEDLLFNLAYMKEIKRVAVIDRPLYWYIQNNGQDTLSSRKRQDKYDIAVGLCEAVKEFYKAVCTSERSLRTGLEVINTRLLLEFLDEIEGMAYDASTSRDEKMKLLNRYMTDSYIRKAGKKTAAMQIDYKLLHILLRHGAKYPAYWFIYIRKWCLSLIRRRG